MSNSPSGDLQSTDRFLVERLLGSGGMGEVYRAYDCQRGRWVAIKTVRRADPASIFRLKREFRSVAELSHPNLVALYELFCEREQWFFTMEFVEGSNFLDHTRGPREADRKAGTGAGTLDRRNVAASDVRESPVDDFTHTAQCCGTEEDALPPPPNGFAEREIVNASPHHVSRDELQRLRGSLRQLVEGVCFLHRAGKVHRDLKPGNVLVTSAGRVVILDFGLATGLAVEQRSSTTEGLLAGTVSYMAPEQAVGGTVGPASDWYAVGVMVYEALTGRLPFAGRPLEVLMHKQTTEPRPPCELARGIPDDLNALCIRLLRRDSAARPSDEELLQFVGSAPAPSSAPTQTARSASLRPFVGRQAQLDVLKTAIENVRQAQTKVVLVEGQSGVGKTALVRRFLDSLGASAETVVLAGRCYQCESVPFRGLDSLIDALSHYLLRRSSLEIDALLPRDVAALSQAFPVLRRVKAIAEAPRRDSRTQDQGEQRDRAFSALRELLSRLGDRRTVVLHIDDFQWGDLDSVALLDDVLRPPDPPRLLVVIGFRSEDRETSPALRALLAAKPAPGGADVRRLEIGPLSPEESRQLAALLIGVEGREAKEVGEWIARESGGNPYFVDALVHHRPPRQDAAPLTSSVPVGLDEVLWAKACSMPAGAFRLLEVIAVAGHPLRSAEACQAAGLSEQTNEMLTVLRAARLIRSSGDSAGESLEAYHDRVRESVVARLPREALASCHRRLAETLEVSGAADPAVLASHYARAGASEIAGRWYAVAAARAGEALAFDRSANLYRLALESAPSDTAGSRVLRHGLADALANAGRGAEAAREYLELVPLAPPDEAPELRRCAAMQYLACGHVDDGLAVLRSVLADAGIRYPRTSREARWSLLLSQTCVWLRGLEFRPRRESDISSAELRRIDICWSAGVGLGSADPVRGAAFHALGLRLALRCGEPYRVGRALAAASMHVPSAGRRGIARRERFLERAAAVERDTRHPQLDGILWLARAFAAYSEGRWRGAFECFDRSAEIFRSKCTGVTWELDSAQGGALLALHPLGELAEIASRLPAIRAAAERRGDLYAACQVGTYVGTTVLLAANDPDHAERELRSLAARWSQAGFHVQHFQFLYAQAFIDRYRGEGTVACRRWEEAWPLLVGSQVFRNPVTRIMARHSRAASALVAAQRTSQPQEFLRQAEEYTRALHRYRARWTDGLWRLLRAGFLASRGEPTAAMPLVAQAMDDFAAWEWGLYWAAARRRLGELRGGPEGQSLVNEANAWMTRQGVVDPTRMTALYAPGFPSRES